MSTKIAKSAASVQEALRQLNLDCKVLELPSSTRTALDAALAIGCDVCQIVKSLIFRTEKTGKPVLILASGPNQVDVTLVASHLGDRIVKADAEFVRQVTGFAIGGIPPVGHKNGIDLIYIDETLIVLDNVWAAAGTPNAVFCIQSQDLIQATGGKVMPVSKI